VTTRDKEFSSVVSTTKTALEVFNNPYIQKSTSTSDFNIKELRSSKLTIYLSCVNTILKAVVDINVFVISAP
jgi:type IV secretion system protein VirD4